MAGNGGLDRRSFLKGGAAAAVGAAAASKVGPAIAQDRGRGRGGRGGGSDGRTHLTDPPPPLPAAPPSNFPVDCIGVLMMENRSYDTYFGWLEGGHGFLNLGLELSYTGQVGGQTISASPEHWAPLYRRCHPHTDPDHSWNGGRAQMSEGFLAGRNTEYALAYYMPEDIPYYARLARQFTVLDHYHCAIMGPTFPNREYQHSGTCGGLKNNAFPPQVGGEHTLGFAWPTIWDQLDAAGVSWAYYFVDLPVIALWGVRNIHGARPITQFFVDAATGNLPQVFFVDPGFLTVLRTDDHPSQADMRSAQAFVNNIVQAFVRSNHWERGAFFINYDEWGGFFDHFQQPPRVPDDLENPGDLSEDFGQIGFRVPCLALSPYSRKGYVHHLGPASGPEAYEHTSILKFIAWRYGLPPLTKRVEHARNIGEVFDYAQAPRLEIGIDQIETPTVFISAGNSDCPPGDPIGISEVPGLGEVVPDDVVPGDASIFDQLAEFAADLGFEIGSPSWESIFGFTDGLSEISGVAQAAEGAGQLAEGVAGLADGLRLPRLPL